MLLSHVVGPDHFCHVAGRVALVAVLNHAPLMHELQPADLPPER